MGNRLAIIGLTLALATPALAKAPRWEYFDAPVKVLEVFKDRRGEGSVFSGMEIKDKLDTYTIICNSRTEQGHQEEGSYIRWSDGFTDTPQMKPRAYLKDPRGTPYTMLQWAEACTRLKLAD